MIKKIVYPKIIYENYIREYEKSRRKIKKRGICRTETDLKKMKNERKRKRINGKGLTNLNIIKDYNKI